MTSTIRCIENFVVEDGEVQCETKTDGMCWLHLILGDVECIVVGTLGFLDDFCNWKSDEGVAT